MLLGKESRLSHLQLPRVGGRDEIELEWGKAGKKHTHLIPPTHEGDYRVAAFGLRLAWRGLSPSPMQLKIETIHQATDSLTGRRGGR